MCHVNRGASEKGRWVESQNTCPQAAWSVSVCCKVVSSVFEKRKEKLDPDKNRKKRLEKLSYPNGINQLSLRDFGDESRVILAVGVGTVEERSSLFTSL